MGEFGHGRSHDHAGGHDLDHVQASGAAATKVATACDPVACACVPSDLTRFSVAVPGDLLAAFDELTARRGAARNRSEAVRDLMRAALVKEDERDENAQVIGSLTMIYDHHTGDLTRRLDEVQHDYTAEIVSTMHVHLDHHNCLEILALKGLGARVYELADKLLGLRGVKHGELTCAATDASLEL